MKPGDPGLETWPNLDTARHGGGQVWIPGSYDPETKYYIFGTGNPTPGYTGAGRKGDNLFTCSLVAVHVDTGKMAWYFQTSVHDTHDWDSAQTPILIDTTIDGKPRKLVSTAARNGYFYTLDRVTGKHLVTSKYGSTTNWALSQRPTGEIDPNPGKEATIPGSLVSPVEGGVTNWPPPAYSEDTGLFYVQEHNGFNLLYLTDPDPRGSMGLGGKSVAQLGSLGDYLTAIDPKTGKVAWRHPFYGGGGGGLLTTAGRVVFSGDGSRQLRGLRRDQRQAAVALAHRQHLERAADLQHRRPPARARRRRRHAVRVRDVLTATERNPNSWIAHGRSSATTTTRLDLSSSKSTLGSYLPFRPQSATVTVEFGAVTHPGLRRDDQRRPFPDRRAWPHQRDHCVQPSARRRARPVRRARRSAWSSPTAWAPTARRWPAGWRSPPSRSWCSSIGKWNVRVNERTAWEIVQRAERFYRRVGETVTDASHQHPSLAGMSTTLTAAYSGGDELFVVHVGHSRGVPVSRWPAYAPDPGSDARAAAGRNRPDGADRARRPRPATRADGRARRPRRRARHRDPELPAAGRRRGAALHQRPDRSGRRRPDRERLSVPPPGSLSARNARPLCDLALERGGPDNITAVMARYRIP